MRKKILVSAALLIAASTTLAACSSSGGSGTGSTGTASGSKTLTIGVVSDFTGVASSTFTTDVKGVQAYVNAVNAAGGINGEKLSYVVGDTTSTPTGALTAVQELVQRDHVFAIVENSSVFYGAEAYALKADVPVVGSAIDGPIWTDPKNTNLYSAVGVLNLNYIQLAEGKFEKNEGVTKCASVGYSSSVSSQQSASDFVQSCVDNGLKSGYLNLQLPFGSTDVGPIALAMKAAGVDGLYLPTSIATAFSLVAALHQDGVNLKSVVLPDGYGGDLLASKATVTAAQGDGFATIGAPAEANTPATKLRAANLAKVGVTGPPTFSEQEAYLTMVALGDGLKAAGANPTQASFMKAMNAMTDYNGDGLLAPDKISFRDYAPASYCLWVALLKGQSFVVAPGMPVCGANVKPPS
jgi:branched-chain amino acid transport system substrate-binding protein